jgi:hypothetical protein
MHNFQTVLNLSGINLKVSHNCHGCNCSNSCYFTFYVKITLIKSVHFLKHLTNSVMPEPEGSSPHSQQPTNDPYPEPGESTPNPPPTNLPKVHFDPIYALVFFLRAFPPKPCTLFYPILCMPHALPTSFSLI